MSEALSREERDALVARVADASAKVFVPGGDPEPSYAIRARKRDSYLDIVGEYADRLPRVPMSACPFTGKPLLRSFDPFGTDGPWWHKDRTFTPDEPAQPKTFRALLGALDLRGRPPEARETVLAGPAVPFVVPQLLGLPGMLAVVSRIEMVNGNLAYPIAYFSREDIPSAALHQFWTRPELWFKDADGASGWTASNAAWDFELAPWVESGQLRWIGPGDAELRVIGRESGGRCPYLGLPGDRQPQVLAAGQRELEEAPDGTPPDPFE